MVNWASPALKIIFIDSIEVLIFNKCSRIICWKRHTDDIFFISSSSPKLILDKANDCNQFIKFT